MERYAAMCHIYWVIGFVIIMIIFFKINIYLKSTGLINRLYVI